MLPWFLLSTGGRCISAEYIDKVGEVAKKHGLKLHIDGARIFNASVALGVPVHRLVQAANLVSVCLSKGLGAPIGSVIVGSTSFIAKGSMLCRDCSTCSIGSFKSNKGMEWTEFDFTGSVPKQAKFPSGGAEYARDKGIPIIYFPKMKDESERLSSSDLVSALREFNVEALAICFSCYLWFGPSRIKASMDELCRAHFGDNILDVSV